ncbi:hypothetical protein KAX02_09300 [candidate division WOR-3 bacterium]|nr:hypothetical protein [candidate division WOR-3 bacterium]
MISKDKLKGKYITYLDKQGKYRTHKVVKINGLTLTVTNVLGEKHRIHHKKFKIFGRQLKNKLEEIEW